MARGVNTVAPTLDTVLQEGDLGRCVLGPASSIEAVREANPTWGRCASQGAKEDAHGQLIQVYRFPARAIVAIAQPSAHAAEPLLLQVLATLNGASRSVVVVVDEHASHQLSCDALALLGRGILDPRGIRKPQLDLADPVADWQRVPRALPSIFAH